MGEYSKAIHYCMIDQHHGKHQVSTDGEKVLALCMPLSDRFRGLNHIHPFSHEKNENHIHTEIASCDIIGIIWFCLVWIS